MFDVFTVNKIKVRKQVKTGKQYYTMYYYYKNRKIYFK